MMVENTMIGVFYYCVDNCSFRDQLILDVSKYLTELEWVLNTIKLNHYGLKVNRFIGQNKNRYSLKKRNPEV